jgi:uncharacterized membrane protein
VLSHAPSFLTLSLLFFNLPVTLQTQFLEGEMNRIVLAGMLLALLSLIIGLLGKIIGHNIIFANATWHNFAQTCLLFAVAYGIGRLAGEKK